MNWLSLFDGMSCGHIAAERCGLPVTKYFASEIKKHTIEVTKHNYPDTIHIGDVTKVSYSNGILFTENGNHEAYIDIVIGGSPCQNLSRMNMNQTGLKGEQSRLFWEYVRIWKETNAKYFFLENVASAPDRDLAIISETLGVPGVRINSSLVSAQLRDRIYWTNIPGTGKDLFGNPCIEQPEDKHIYFKDILDSGYTEKDKAYCLLARAGGRWSHIVKDDKYKQDRFQKQLIHRYNKGFENIVFEDDSVRLLSAREQERLQTIPEGYTNILSYVDATNVLGDGWTIDVISHIFQGLKNSRI